MSEISKTILLCAGGTGGHLFPAQALGNELQKQGWIVHLATDDRAQRFSKNFPASEIHIVKSATFTGLNPLKLVRTGWSLVSGYIQARTILKKIRPSIVVGFGGYPSVPPLWASSTLGMPTILHEQNAVMGRANRLLSKRATAIVMGFDAAATRTDPKVLVLGNPVREAVNKAAQTPYAKRRVNDKFKLVVFGGSQGAQYFSKVLPDALALFKKNLRDRINIVQQARPEDEMILRNALEDLGVINDVASFFTDMPGEISRSHLVIARGGASTVSECAAIGRPSILIPLPGSLDQDQAMNAAEMEKSGGCMVIKQSDLSAQKLANELAKAIKAPRKLGQMAKAAKKTARVNATQDLADLVTHLACGNTVSSFSIKDNNI